MANVLLLANQRIGELCEMVNVLAKFRKVRAEDYQVDNIKVEEMALDKHVRWKDGELGYLHCLIAQRGDDSVTRDPKTIAAYLRIQASQAFRDGFYVLAAAIGEAATAINCDARNNHEPDWKRAEKAIRVPNSVVG